MRTTWHPRRGKHTGSIFLHIPRRGKHMEAFSCISLHQRRWDWSRFCCYYSASPTNWQMSNATFRLFVQAGITRNWRRGTLLVSTWLFGATPITRGNWQGGTFFKKNLRGRKKRCGTRFPLEREGTNESICEPLACSFLRYFSFDQRPLLTGASSLFMGWMHLHLICSDFWLIIDKSTWDTKTLLLHSKTLMRRP